MGVFTRPIKVLKKGEAQRVAFYYPGEEGTYIDQALVTVYENGIVHIESKNETTTTHLQNCEILWKFNTLSSLDGKSGEGKSGGKSDAKVRLLRREEL